MGDSGEPGRNMTRIKETQIVKRPSTVNVVSIEYSGGNRNSGVKDEGPLTQKQPLPSVKTSGMVQLQNPRRQHGADGVGAKHAKEEHGNALGKLAPCVPGREGVDGAGNIPGLAEAQDDAGR